MTNINIEVVNLVPKFLSFFDKAELVKGMDDKWKLWQSEYNFAAIPPTEEGLAKAKQDFIGVYNQYYKYEDRIRRFQYDEVMIKQCILQLQKELLFKNPFSIKIVYFVGFFENNPFVTTDQTGELCLCLPIENDMNKTIEQIRLYHELSHIFHSEILNINFTYQRSLGFLIMQEGIALQMSRKMVPGCRDDSYISHQLGWYDDIKKYQLPILIGIEEDIWKNNPEVLYKYTMGQGNTGHEREAYYVGWIVVNLLLKEGYPFLELMTLDEQQSNLLVKQFIEKTTA